MSQTRTRSNEDTAPTPRRRTAKSLQRTARDFEILQDLFLTDYMPLEHLTRLHFPDTVPKRAYNRLNALAKKGYIKNELVSLSDRHAPPDRVRRRRINFYGLTRAGREDMAGIMHGEGLTPYLQFANTPALPPDSSRSGGGGKRASGPSWLAVSNEFKLDSAIAPKSIQSERAAHAYGVSDLYARIKVNALLKRGRAPVDWMWRNERRAFVRYESGGRNAAYQPDAELIVTLDRRPLSANVYDPNRSYGDNYFHFYFEYQTEASHASAERMIEKIRDHNHATGLPGFPPKRRRVLVIVTDSEHLRTACEREAAKLETPLIFGGAARIAQEIATTLND